MTDDVGKSLKLFVRLPQSLVEFVLLGLNRFARSIVRADQQVADDNVLLVPQSRDGNNRRKPAAVLANIRQLVNVFDAARCLKDQRVKPGRNKRPQFRAEGFCARDHFLCIGNIRRGDFIDHFRRRVAEHPLRADVEDLNHAVGIGRDTGEIGAVKNSALQGACFHRVTVRCGYSAGTSGVACGDIGHDHRFP